MEFAGVNVKRRITGKSDGGNETHNKRHHTLTRSRLSELPDLAFGHILSHLYTEEAARTSVLSKRFNSLWNSVDSLTFSDQYSGRNGAVFVEFVDAALRLHVRKFIDKFSLEIDYTSLIKDSVDAWLNFAAQKQALSTLEAYNLSSPWSERRCLTLSIPIIDWSHLGIASLLHGSPHLESLVIKLSYCSDTCVLEHAKPPSADSKHYWKSWSTISKCPLLHLKTVKVVGFQVSCRSMEPLFHFLEFLLENSEVLEEIIIQASRYVTRAALDEAMKLLSVRTASPDVVVQFEPPHLWVDPLCMYNENPPLFLT